VSGQKCSHHMLPEAHVLHHNLLGELHSLIELSTSVVNTTTSTSTTTGLIMTMAATTTTTATAMATAMATAPTTPSPRYVFLSLLRC
jgi:hypothetical protein